MLRLFLVFSFIMTIILNLGNSSSSFIFQSEDSTEVNESIIDDYNVFSDSGVFKETKLHNQSVFRSFIQEDLNEEDLDGKVSKVRKISNYFTFFETFILFDKDNLTVPNPVNVKKISNWTKTISLPKLCILHQVFLI